MTLCKVMPETEEIYESIVQSTIHPQYANQAYLQQLHWQQRDAELRREIANIVKAVHDYFDAARKIAPGIPANGL